MKINKQYKRDIYNNYMVLEACEDNRFEARMLMENNINGIMPLQIRNIDSVEYYYYDISSRQPIGNLFERGQLKFDQLKRIVNGIFQALDEGRKYLLNENDFVLNIEYIFITLSSFSVSLCYYPGYNEDISMQLTGIIEYLMDKADHTDEKAVMLVYGLYKATKHECTIDDLRGVVEEAENSDNRLTYSYSEECNKETYTTVESVVDKSETQTIIQDNTEIIHLSDESKKIQVRKNGVIIVIYVMCSVAMLFVLSTLGLLSSNSKLNVPMILGVVCIIITIGVTIWNKFCNDVKDDECQEEIITENDLELTTQNQEFIVSDNDEVINSESEEDYECETVLLADYRKNKSVRLASSHEDMYESVVINSMPFIVGKLKDKVDCVLNDDKVSRMHAKIYRIDNEQIMITDLNSKNGTFVNGERLLANETRKINPGDEISFADLEFILQ